jgi:hypothetical protein
LSPEIFLLWISSFFQFARYHPSSLSKNVNRDEGCKFKCQNIGMRSFFWKLFFRIFIPNRYRNGLAFVFWIIELFSVFLTWPNLTS